MVIWNVGIRAFITWEFQFLVVKKLMPPQMHGFEFLKGLTLPSLIFSPLGKLKNEIIFNMPKNLHTCVNTFIKKIMCPRFGEKSMSPKKSPPSPVVNYERSLTGI